MKRKNLYTENGEPKRIRCYMFKQNPKPYADYITVVYTYASKAGYPTGTTVYRAMSGAPFHPLGIGYFVDKIYINGFHAGGSRVKFSELPHDCQELVRRDYSELWEDGSYIAQNLQNAW